MSANNITQLCQKAAKAFLDSENLSFITDNSQIVTGIASEEVQLTQVLCQCQSAQAAVPWEGNWSALLRIEIRNNCNDVDDDEHHEMAGELFGKFMTSIEDGRANLSSEEFSFTCQQLLPSRQGWELNDNSWVSFIEFQVECCGSFFSVA